MNCKEGVISEAGRRALAIARGEITVDPLIESVNHYLRTLDAERITGTNEAALLAEIDGYRRHHGGTIAAALEAVERRHNGTTD